MIGTFRSVYSKLKTLLFGATTEPADTPAVSAPALVLSKERTSSPVLVADSPALTGENLNAEPESPAPEVLVVPESATVTTVSEAWSVRTYVDPVFVKVGRIYLDAGDLIIRSDRDSRGFLLSKEDIELAFAGESGTIQLMDLTATVGTAHLSTSGLALNMVIDQQLHTVPLRSLIPVLNGNHRKAPLFVPKEDVAPD
ncbi:MAG: hypothetical protein WC406_05140 [Methanoregula sp.]|jgi:hypothetical protein|nr:hypothetical protein [Methanoregula sp.]